MSLPETIELGILEPSPSKKKITLNTIAAKESTIKKVSVNCKGKDEQTLYLTRCCTYVKTELKCSIAFYGDNNVYCGPTCLNISSTGT